MPLAPAIYRSDLPDAFLLLVTLEPQTAQTMTRTPRAAPGPWLSRDIDARAGEALRVVNNTLPVTSRGRVFEPYPFTLVLAPDTGDKVREVRVVLDNVDRQLVEIVRALQFPPLVTIELILASTPNTSERTINFLRLDSADYDAQAITLSLQPAHVMSRQFPRSTYSPAVYPGMFL